MAKGARLPGEERWLREPATGARIRQVTSAPAIHHHPFFIVPASDDGMHRLVFVSHRTGRPELFAEERATGDLVQLTDRPDLAEWSFHPSHDGRFVLFTAGSGAWRLDLETYEETCLLDFGHVATRERGMVGAALGVTALSHDDRWWAVPVKSGDRSHLYLFDLARGTAEVILERDSIGHPQFCPDDSSLILYAGPPTDRLWLVRRDGRQNRRLYRRRHDLEWITHESWIPGRRELAFVDWPHGLRAIYVDTGTERVITRFPAWHASADPTGRRFVCDTTCPDTGLYLLDALDGVGEAIPLCRPEASCVGAHWAGPFPYNRGHVEVYAPQHTHPHPRFAPDGSRVVFTSDRTGHAQVYECLLS